MSDFKQAYARLKTSRMAGGYKTATEFCANNNIPLSTYNMHETGRRKMMPAVAEKYAQILEVSAGWLLTGQGSPYPEYPHKNDEITAKEFTQFLNYQGNRKITPKKIQHGSINTALFCDIFNAVTNALQNYAAVDIAQIADFSTEIYQDIIHISQEPAQQQTMIALAITILKKNLNTKL